MSHSIAMEKQAPCYLCGGVEFKKRPGSVRDKSDLDVFECVHCGLVFLSSFDHINDGFYESSEMHGEKAPDIRAWLREASWDDERRFEYLKPILPNRSLLDFGCGAGGFLQKAGKLTATAHGVEPEARLKRHYDDQGLTVFPDLSRITSDTQTGYDIITLFHVLEHIPDPRSLLAQLSDLLARGGQMIVEVPNADDALLTLYHNEPFSHFTYWSCHLFLYTAQTLRSLFAQVHLKINYIRQIQRYPLSNHLYWLANGKPGGHQAWHFLDSPELRAAYEKQLAALGKCDTIIASVSKS